MKKIIGIVPAVDFNPDRSTMCDWYKIGNNYVKRVAEAGCTPISIAPVDEWIDEEALDLCGGFIVQGGEDFSPYHFQVIHHAFTHGKRYLGICLGEQLIYCYFYMRKVLELKGEDSSDVYKIWELYSMIEKDTGSLGIAKPLTPVNGHYEKTMTRGKEDEVKQDVKVVSGTILHRLLGKETFRGASYHYVRVPAEQDLVKVNAWAADGSDVVEGVEYGENILGVQCHPEVDDRLPEIFTFLAEE